MITKSYLKSIVNGQFHKGDMKIRKLIETLNAMSEEDKERVIVNSQRKCSEDFFYKKHKELNAIEIGFRFEGENTRILEPEILATELFSVVRGKSNEGSF